MKTPLILLTLSLLSPLSSRAETAGVDSFKESLGWGMRFGFGARSTDMQALNVSGHPIKDYTKNNQVGYCGTLFARYNTPDMFFQAEGSVLHSRTSISFDRNSWNTADPTLQNSTFATDQMVLRAGVNAGYKVVNQPPYTMSLYTGPVAEHVLESFSKTEFSGFASDDMYEEIAPVQIAWKTGLECTIGNAVFCFEYQKGLHNISRGIYDSTTGELSEETVLNRTNGILSFSVGLIF